MHYQTLKVDESTHSLRLTLHRPEQRNSINAQLITDIGKAMDEAERNSSCRFIILQGENGIFCTGMDFQELTTNKDDNGLTNVTFLREYMALLKRFTTTSKIIVSLLDGQVLAGGVGIVAASDLVLSTADTTFGLSEVLWGLLPACVTPFLIRRIGFQKAYQMTLTAQTMIAHEAHRVGLIDELTENLNDSMRRIAVRVCRIQEDTVANLKGYFRKMWIITDEMETTAIAELNRLVNQPQVQTRIENFVKHQQLPWETTT
ncbi:MAG: enoyl-CoA hydratase/isomerase family protein [Legionella sp.]|nr:enoyl-CoA hydratase/isomerase family protein [Legionella sp.]